MLKIPILYEDDVLIVVDKPAGLPVHPGNAADTRQTFLDYIADKVHDPGSDRPGIVHRLDKDTSGVLVVAKDAHTKTFLQQQFRQRTVTKQYIGSVRGVPDPEHARIEVPVGRHPKNPLKRAVRPDGRPAATEYRVRETARDASLLDIRPYTGRTHQIRVHMQYRGRPLLGDALYGSPHPGLERHFLHAASLTFLHPEGNAPLTYTSELPGELRRVWYNGG